MFPRTSALVPMLALLPVFVTAAGCSQENDAPSSDEPVVVEITFADGDVTPVAERREVAVGQPIDLVVTADEPGELHVHSDPEQEFSYDAGEQTIELEIAASGVVAVESHDLGVTIVEFEVK